MSDVIDEHRLYLSDRPRLDAYTRAFAETVGPADVVVDLGAGSGILGMLAVRAGAARVYAIEQTGLIGLTRRIAAANGMEDRIVHIRASSMHAELPERADVVCCDQIGRFGFEAGVFGYFADAARRLAKPDARFMPSHIEMWLAPVSLPVRAAHAAFWDEPVRGLDVSAVAPIARNSGYPVRLERGDLLGAGASVTRRETTNDAAFAGEVEIEIERAGTFDGMGGWFRAELAPGVFVTNSPLETDRIERRNVFLPIEEPVPVAVGSRVRVRLHVIPGETLLSWSVQVLEPSGGVVARSRHSTFQGLLLSAEDLRLTAPQTVPKLTPWGVARRTVLELCDGARTLGEIEAELAGRHPELLPGPREASRFVAEVVTRYAT